MIEVSVLGIFGLLFLGALFGFFVGAWLDSIAWKDAIEKYFEEKKND